MYEARCYILNVADTNISGKFLTERGELSVSVDELFAAVTVPRTEIEAYAGTIRSLVSRWLGLSVSIGIAPSKVLSKLAVEIAKKQDAHVAALCEPEIIAEELRRTPVQDIWTIGPARAATLQRIEVTTAWQFAQLPVGQVRHLLSVVGTRVQAELQGHVAFPIQRVAASPQQIAVCRAFGHILTTAEELREPLVMYTSRVAEKLREEQMAARRVSVSVATNPFARTAQYHRSLQIPLPYPTDETRLLIEAALIGLHAVYRDGYRYHRVGVFANDLVPTDPEQGRLWAPRWQSERERRLAQTVDTINRRWGRETIRLLGSGTTRTWASRSENRSPCVLTRWDELMRVHVR